jgi:hypothetical protein
MSTPATVPLVMPFGKYLGEPVFALPRDYVRWLVMQSFVRAEHPAIYRKARSIVMRIFKEEIAAEEPSPPRPPGEPFRVLTAAEFAAMGDSS